MADPIRTAQWATAMAHDPRSKRLYSEEVQNPEVGGFRAIFNGGAGAPKCNIFVWDALGQGSMRPRSVNGQARIAYVSDWSNRNSRIDGFRPLNVDSNWRRTELVRAGDVIANRGHVGIVVAASADGTIGMTASAAAIGYGDKVTIVPFGFRKVDGPASQIVVWRSVVWEAAQSRHRDGR